MSDYTEVTKEMIRGVFGEPAADMIRITLSKLQLSKLRDGETLEFRAGKQTITIAQEK